jgi:PPK2 family polyphosphate:nucleotide phosphotransferase
MSYAHVVHPGAKVDLSDVPTKDDGDLTKEVALAQTGVWGEELRELQDLLYFSSEASCLIVLQGMDTSGKDGMIRCLTKYVNIQGCRVASFKQPTPEELEHDFLWRVHAQVPGKGQMKVFNRSHYEDVLVARVHDLVPKNVWQRRFEQINNFEKLLCESGTIILKFFLHISMKEQEERLLEREQDTTKAWKLSVGDWKERELWDDYQKAYEEALEKCSTEWAPWHIVPADRKWYRDLAVLERIVKTLKPYRSEWYEKLDRIGRSALREIDAYRDSSRNGKQNEVQSNSS